MATSDSEALMMRIACKYLVDKYSLDCSGGDQSPRHEPFSCSRKQNDPVLRSLCYSTGAPGGNGSGTVLNGNSYFEVTLKPWMNVNELIMDTVGVNSTLFSKGVGMSLVCEKSATSLFAGVVEQLNCSLAGIPPGDPDVLSAPAAGATPAYDWSFLFVIFFIVAGGVGNILVCLAIYLDKSLHNVTNYFLLSLAVADLLVSLFVMPLGAIPGFLGFWPLGLVWCNIYVTCDVLACSSSIMHMCFISIGRYFGIRNPLATRQTYSTRRVVGMKVAIVWLLAMLVSSYITILGIQNPENIMPEPHKCAINNRPFWVFGSLIAFYIPMAIMVFSFAITVRLLKKKAKFVAEQDEKEAFRRLGGHRSSRHDRVGLHRTSGRHTAAYHEQQMMMSNSKNENSKSGKPSNACEVGCCLTCWSVDDDEKGLGVKKKRFWGLVGRRSHEGSGTPDGLDKESRKFRLKSLKLQLNVSPSTLNLGFLNNKNKKQSLEATAVATEQKASKVLGLVFSAFVLCWTPFFLLNILFAACPGCNVSEYIVNICLWLGYVSSTINPIIYTIFNKTFRAAFIRLLRCDCKPPPRMTRYLSVNENRSSTLMTTPSSAAAGIAALPISLSLQCDAMATPSSSGSSYMMMRTPDSFVIDENDEDMSP